MEVMAGHRGDLKEVGASTSSCYVQFRIVASDLRFLSSIPLQCRRGVAGHRIATAPRRPWQSLRGLAPSSSPSSLPFLPGGGQRRDWRFDPLLSALLFSFT